MLAWVASASQLQQIQHLVWVAVSGAGTLVPVALGIPNVKHPLPLSQMMIQAQI